MNRQKLLTKLSYSVFEEFKLYNLKIKTEAPELKINKKSISILRKEFGNKKEIPKEFEQHILYALSFYPELKNVKICFQIKPAIFLMETRMRFFSLFSGERHYIINIRKKYANFLLHNFSVKGLAGLIGHEIGHVLDYEHKSNFELARFAFKYIHSKSRRRIELTNDLRTFYHGLGASMILYEQEYMNAPLPDSFKKYHDSFYLRKEELEWLSRNRGNKITKKD